MGLGWGFKDLRKKTSGAGFSVWSNIGLGLRRNVGGRFRDEEMSALGGSQALEIPEFSY